MDFLLAIPDGVIPAEDVDGSSQGQVGPSTVLSVPGVLLEDRRESPIGADLPVLLVDIDASVSANLRVMEENEDSPCQFLRGRSFCFARNSIADCFGVLLDLTAACRLQPRRTLGTHQGSPWQRRTRILRGQEGPEEMLVAG